MIEHVKRCCNYSLSFINYWKKDMQHIKNIIFDCSVFERLYNNFKISQEDCQINKSSYLILNSLVELEEIVSTLKVYSKSQPLCLWKKFLLVCSWLAALSVWVGDPSAPKSWLSEERGGTSLLCLNFVIFYIAVLRRLFSFYFCITSFLNSCLVNYL